MTDTDDYFYDFLKEHSDHGHWHALWNLTPATAIEILNSPTSLHVVGGHTWQKDQIEDESDYLSNKCSAYCTVLILDAISILGFAINLDSWPWQISNSFLGSNKKALLWNPVNLGTFNLNFWYIQTDALFPSSSHVLKGPCDTNQACGFYLYA